MALSCPADLDVAALRAEVRAMYERLAAAPEGQFHFHRGPEYAARTLGYDRALLARLPADVTARFAGVGNPLAIRPLEPGATVLDVGCGSGTDLLLAALSVGPTGQAIGVDILEMMRACATAGAAACGLSNVELREGDATSLPLEDESVDIVISNGVLNLIPRKAPAIDEIARVLRSGGRVQLADIVVGKELPEAVVRDIDLWTG
jgi:arsenite methyltransferase